jgi:hypothetical protein
LRRLLALRPPSDQAGVSLPGAAEHTVAAPAGAATEDNGAEGDSAIGPGDAVDAGLLDETEARLLHFFDEARQFAHGTGDPAAIAAEVRGEVETTLQLFADDGLAVSGLPAYREAIAHVRAALRDPGRSATLFAWLLSHNLGKVVTAAGYEQQTRAWIEEWQLGKILAGAMEEAGLDAGAAWHALETIKVLSSHERWGDRLRRGQKAPQQVLEAWLQDADVQRYLGVNRFQDALWFNKESFDQFLWWMMVAAVITSAESPHSAGEQQQSSVASCYGVVRKLQKAAEKSQYRVENLLAEAKA